MRRTVYLNFDLSKPVERACYKFLVDSDRAKKKIICTLLTNSGLVNPKLMITDDELPKLKKGQELAREEAGELVAEDTFKADKVDDTIQNIEKGKSITAKNSVITSTFPDGTPIVKEDNLYSKLTEDQKTSMKQRGIDYEILNSNQLKVLADRLNDGYPYKAAYTEALFTV